MDEVELSLSQAESKYDDYVEMCRNLKDENEHLKNNVETRTKEQEERILEMRKGAGECGCINVQGLGCV
jgi:Mg2+ and Co2+ transporter CorA